MVSIYELKLGTEKLEILKVLSAEIEKAIDSIGKIDNSRLNAIYNDILEKANQVLQDKNLVQELKDKVDVAHKDISEKAATINQKFEQQQALQQSLQKLKAEIEALLKSGIINDTAQSAIQTYSSNLIERKLAGKANVGDSYSKIEANVKFETLAQGITTAMGAAAAAQSSAAGKLGKDEQASDSAKLGGLAADKYAEKDDIPAAPQAATETKAGIVKLKNSITGSLEDAAVSEKAAKEYMDKNASIGIGQTWQDVTSERHTGVTYTNTTGRPIFISVYMNSNVPGGSSAVEIFVDDKLISGQYAGLISDITPFLSACAIVPFGSTYSAKTTRTQDNLYQDASRWLELR